MRQIVPLVLLLLLGLPLSACGDGDNAGEAGTSAESLPEAEPDGVGGTSNQ